MSNPAVNTCVFDKTKPISPDTSSYMTINGSIIKTFILGVIFSITSITIIYYLSYNFNMDTEEIPAGFIIIIFLTAVLAFITGIIIMRKPHISPFMAPLYSIFQAIPIALISYITNQEYNGIVMEAVIYTMITFFSMLLLYIMRIIKPGRIFVSVIITATTAVGISYLILFILSFFYFGHDLYYNIYTFDVNPVTAFYYGNSKLSIILSIVIIIIAALNLIIDFSFIEQGAQSSQPKYMEWYAAFGLMVTIIWIYIEILRLLGKKRR